MQSHGTIGTYQVNIQQALEDLRRRASFAAKEFRGSELNPSTPEEAVETMDEEGTASILDITTVAPKAEYFAVCPLTNEQLEEYFGTTQPTRQDIEQNIEDFFEEIERGQGVYIIAYQHGQPSEIFFGGYSFD